jgi:hypothetical protein
MRVFLPGINDGRLSFQELLCLYHFHMERHKHAEPAQSLADITGSGIPLDESVRASAGEDQSAAKKKSSSTEALKFLLGTDPLTAAATAARIRMKKAEEEDKQSAGRDVAGEQGHEGDAHDSDMFSFRRGWKLPTRATAGLKTKDEITDEFKKLDILDEGRLTLLTLKTALELREVRMDDASVLAWLRETDVGNKGYVDMFDYEQIFRESAKLKEVRRKEDDEEIGRRADPGTSMYSLSGRRDHLKRLRK